MDATPVPRSTDRDIIDRILAIAAATWMLPAIIAIVVTVFGAGVIALVRLATPTTTTYLARIQFTFPEVTRGQLPNLSPFSLNELIDPSILNILYKDFDIGNLNISLDEFVAGFAIRPFAPEGDELAERFRAQLADRRLTFAERERIETQLRAALDQASRLTAEISFTVRRRFGIPDSVGRTIVQRLPQVWALRMIEERGVLRIPAFSSTPTILSPALIEKLPVPIGIVTLGEAFFRVIKRQRELIQLGEQTTTAGITHVRNSESGKGVSDIERDLRRTEFLTVNPLRVALSQYDFGDQQQIVEEIIRRRLLDLGLEADEATKNADAIGQSVTRYVEAMVGLSGRPKPDAPRGGTGEQSSVVVGVASAPPSDSQIDRIVQLQNRLEKSRSASSPQ